MQKETSSWVSLGLVIIAIAVLMTLGVGVYGAGAKLASGTYEEITFVEISRIMWGGALKVKAISLITTTLGTVMLIVATLRKKLVLTDEVDVYKSSQGLVNECTGNNKYLVEVPTGYKNGDLLVVTRDTFKISLFHYIFKCKQYFINADCRVIRKSQDYKLTGEVKDVGNFYSIGNIIVDKNLAYLMVGDTIDKTITVKDKDAFKVEDTIVLMKG